LHKEIFLCPLPNLSELFPLFVYYFIYLSRFYVLENLTSDNELFLIWLIQIKIRGFLSHIQQLRNGYWGISSTKAQSVSSHGMPSPHPKDAKDENQQPTEATGVGRSWVQSMFTRNPTTRSSSFSHVRRWTSDGSNTGT